MFTSFFSTLIYVKYEATQKHQLFKETIKYVEELSNLTNIVKP